MNKTQKYIVLFVLFFVPLLFYIFLQISTHNFGRLPVVTNNITDITTVDKTKQFQGKVSVVTFLGDSIHQTKGELFNLNEKIYKKFYGYKDFQLIVVIPKGTEKHVEELKGKLSPYTNMIKWNFVYADKPVIKVLYESFNTNTTLDENYHTTEAFIIDKENNLRRGKTKRKEPSLGYNMKSVAELKKEMYDDVKILLAEYRLALKKNSADRQI